MEQRVVLINLMVKLGLAAAIAAGLVRSVEFKSLLFREERSLRDRVYLVLWLVVSAWIGKALVLGVWIRFGPPSTFTGDLSFETTILLGALAGRGAGAFGGALMAMPSVVSGAWILLPLNVLVGLAAGQVRELTPHHDEVWKFSPFNYLSLLRWLRRTEQRPSFYDWQMMFLLSILALRFLFDEAVRWMSSRAILPRLQWADILIY